MITDMTEYQKAQEELHSQAGLELTHPGRSKRFTKAGIRRMIARHEEIALYEDWTEETL